MKLYTIDTGLFKLDGGAMFGVVPKNIWNRLVPADENNLCTWAMRCLLIEDDNRLILIDTGIGNKQSEKFLSHFHLHGNSSLKSSLAKHGFGADDITDVILTHLHFDHVGGAVESSGNKLRTAFPNATYWSNEGHWQWAMKPNAREKASFLSENILPLQESGQLKMIDESNPFFSENITIRFANGHTKSMMLPQIRYNDVTLLYMADLLPSTAHLPLPYVMGYDMFPLTTLQEKEFYLSEALSHNYILYFEHDAVNECCTLQQTEKGVRVNETFPLSHVTGY